MRFLFTEISDRVLRSIDSFTIVVTMGLLTLISMSILGADYDVFARIAVGRLVWRDGSVPLLDPFSYTEAGKIFIDHEWLSGLVFYLGACGLRDGIGLVILTLMVALVTVWAVVKAQLGCAMALGGGRSMQQLSVVPAAFITCSFVWNTIVRSYIWTFAGYALLLMIFLRYHRRMPVWCALVIPILMVFWANLHGGFVVGLGFIGCAWFGSLWEGDTRECRLWTLVLVVSFLSIFMNPYGFAYLPFVLDAISKPRPLITEWNGTSLTWSNGLFWITVFFAGIQMLRGGWRYLPVAIRIFFPVCLWAAVSHQRHVPFFMLLIAAIFPALLQSRTVPQWLCERGRTIAISAWISYSVIAIMLIMNHHGRGSGGWIPRISHTSFPVHTVGWLRSHGYAGRLLTHFNQGSYALFAGYPQFLVAVDGRYEELYSDNTVIQVLHALSPDSPKFISSLDELSPNIIVLCEESQPLSDSQRFPPPWRLIYRSDFEPCVALARDGEFYSQAQTPSILPWCPQF